MVLINSSSGHGPSGSLRQRRIEAVTALLDRRHVESRGVCDRLDVSVRTQIRVRLGNGGELTGSQGGDRLRKHEVRVEIGIVGAAAVTRPPACIERELHEVGEPWLAACSRSLASRQRSKLIEIDRG